MACVQTGESNEGQLPRYLAKFAIGNKPKTSADIRRQVLRGMQECHPSRPDRSGSHSPNLPSSRSELLLLLLRDSQLRPVLPSYRQASDDALTELDRLDALILGLYTRINGQVESIQNIIDIEIELSADSNKMV
jgi:hypothetical protein